MAYDQFPCPKCGQVCQVQGDVDDASIDLHLDIFQCGNPACNIMLDLGGQEFEATFVFAVGKDGVAFDPAETMEPIDD